MKLIQKGESLQLASKTGSTLTAITVGLGWGKKEKKRFFGDGTKKVGVDLDASCIVYNNKRKAVDFIWFGHLKSKDGSIRHTGDDLFGGGDEMEPNEMINVHLESMPKSQTTLVFVVNSYSGGTFKGVPFAFCSVIDCSAGSTEVIRYNLQTDGGSHRGFIMAKISRLTDHWRFTAIGEPCTGRQKTVKDIEKQARRFA